MLYCVSYSNGTVGIFSSMDKVKELVFDKYPSITFIIQIFKSNENKSYMEDNNYVVWAIIYKNSETYAYVSDNKNDALDKLDIFNKIGKVYEESTDYIEQYIDTIPESIEPILKSLQSVYGESGIVIDSKNNIISYI